MTEQKNDQSLLEAAHAVGGWIENMLLSLPEHFRGQIQEIGLRAGRPITLSCGREIWFPDGHGQAVRRPQQGVPVVTAQELAAVLHRLCGYSVYSFQEELREGYLTLRGGHRVGVAGTAVMQQGRISAVKEVSSLNIRLAREKKGCADELLRRLGPELSGGLLLAGPPAAGKTTLLRDLARQLAGGETGRFRKVTVVDERGELAGCWQGEPQHDLGVCCDVISGCPKALGILQAVRALSPEFLVCDEVGNGGEVEALLQCLHTGASLIASIHAGTKEELLRRPQAVTLLRAGAFGAVALLGSREAPGIICEWEKAGDLLAQAAGNAAAGSDRSFCRVSGVA